MENKILIKESASNMRAIARQMLKGKWGIAVLGTLAYFVAIYIPTFIIQLVLGDESSIGAILTVVYSILVGGALVLGYTSLMLEIHRRKQAKVSEVFSGFEQFGRAFCIYILTNIFITLWAIPSIILFVIAMGSIMVSAMSMGATSMAIGVVCFVAALILLILPIRAQFAYSQCFFLAIDNPNMRALETIYTSKNLMKGNIWKYFCLLFSFIGWGFLCFLPMTIITVLTIPNELSTLSSMQNPTALGSLGMGSTMGGSSMLINLAIFVASAGYLWLMPYMSVATAGFYEILTGKLTINQADIYSKAQEILTQTKMINQVVDTEKTTNNERISTTENNKEIATTETVIEELEIKVENKEE